MSVGRQRSERSRIGSFESGIASVALVTAAVVLLTACVAFIAQQWDADRRWVNEQNRSLAQIVAEHAGEEMLEGQPGEARHLVQSLVRHPSIKAAYLLGADGELLAGLNKAGVERAPPPARDSRDIGQLREPLRADGRVWGELVIVADDDSIAPLLVRYVAITATLFFAATGLAMFMSRWLAARLLQPVHALSHAMRGLAERGDYTERAPAAADEVFGPLTVTFNALVDKLAANDSALRHSNRELMAARDAAETANVLKSQFLANMSHEIRTPLNGVLAMAQVMELSALDASQRERLTIIRHSGEALLAVLNDVLDLSKIEAGKLELDVAEFDTGPLIRAVAAPHLLTAERKGLGLEVVVAASAEGVRPGDPARLRQIVNNLLSNAVKFTANGRVRVLVEGLGEGGAAGLAVMVEDTGVGVAADKLPLLFEKFSQVDSSATRRFGGTGLGLAISRELATLMGGRISVSSVEGCGSVFRVELPFPRTSMAGPAEAVEAVELTQASPTAEPSADLERAVRILAAEDNPTNQRVLRAVLDTFGVELTLVDNGRKAVEAWSVDRFDLVLMDIQMPEMDGVAATRAIREKEAGSGRPRTPIVALSANAMTHQVAEYLAAGMDAHVAKPIEIAHLQSVLEDVLARTEQSQAA